MRVIPRGPAPTTRANPWSLTQRQAEILQLLSTGLTNAQIAQQLVVSTRTVDHHVSAILQKLAVTSRQAAADLALASLADARANGAPDSHRSSGVWPVLPCTRRW